MKVFVQMKSGKRTKKQEIKLTSPYKTSKKKYTMIPGTNKFKKLILKIRLNELTKRLKKLKDYQNRKGKTEKD